MGTIGTGSHRDSHTRATDNHSRQWVSVPSLRLQKGRETRHTCINYDSENRRNQLTKNMGPSVEEMVEDAMFVFKAQRI